MQVRCRFLLWKEITEFGNVRFGLHAERSCCTDLITLFSLPLLQLLLNLWPINLLCCCCSVTRPHRTLCDPMDCSTPGFPVHHQLPECAQTHVPE